jgi:hypothetical protein
MPVWRAGLRFAGVKDRLNPASNQFAQVLPMERRRALPFRQLQSRGIEGFATLFTLGSEQFIK